MKKNIHQYKNTGLAINENYVKFDLTRTHQECIIPPETNIQYKLHTTTINQTKKHLKKNQSILT